MYDPKFSVKQMYDQYGSTYDEVPTKKVDPKPSRSSGFGGMGPDPAERFGGSPTKGLGSKPDYSSSAYDTGSDNNPNKDEYESKGVVARLYDRAVTTLRNFGADEPEDVIVDGQRVYKGPLFRGFTPDTSNLFVDNNPNRDRRAVMPDSTVNMFGVNTDNPSLNMFGVTRNSFRNPDQLIPPVLPESPANMDPLTRSLSQAMLPPSDFLTTAEYTVSEGESLLTVLDTLNAGKPNSQKVTLEELGELNNIPDAVADPFGKIEKGQVIKVPVKKRTAVGDLRDKIEAERSLQRTLIEYQRLSEEDKQKIQDRYRLLEQAQPATMKEELSLAEQLAEYTKYMKNLAAETLGIDVETDTDKITTAVNKNSLGAKQDITITTDDTEKNITAYQNKLNSLGFSTGVADGVYGENTANGIRRYQERNGLEITGTMNEETANRLNSGNSIVPTSVQVGNLTVSTAYRDDIDSSQLVIATDFNGGGPNAKFGAEVVLPPAVFNAGPGNQHYDAAVVYLDLVKDFFEKKGYGDYFIRPSNVAGGQAGIKRSGQNPSGKQAGRDNTIHLEGFFGNDTKAANIVNENKEEFFDLYIQAFGNTTGAPLIAPHGKISTENKQDQGADSSILGSETELGDEGIKYIMKKYGNK